MVNPLIGWQQGQFLITDDGQMQTHDGNTVLGIDPPELVDSKVQISRGKAAGVRWSSTKSQGMSKAGFKQRIRDFELSHQKDAN